jgi:glycosyltransferase involved in cell wall biosynthesis
MSDIEVVIATYNSATTVATTLESISRQTVLPKKTVLVDDGSIDTTLDEVRRFHSILNLDVVSMDKNSGPWAARNAGFERVSSSHVAFVDSDDLLLPQHIETHLSMLHDGVDAVATRYFDWIAGENLIRLDPREFPDTSVFSQKILQSNFMPSFSSIKSSVFHDVGHFRADVTEDWDFWIRFFAKGYLAKSTETATYLYRWSGDSLSRRSNTLSLNLKTLRLSMKENTALTKFSQYDRTARKLMLHAFFHDPRLLSSVGNEIFDFQVTTVKIFKTLTYLHSRIPFKFRKLLLEFLRIFRYRVNTKFRFRNYNSI